MQLLITGIKWYIITSQCAVIAFVITGICETDMFQRDQYFSLLYIFTQWNEKNKQIKKCKKKKKKTISYWLWFLVFVILFVKCIEVKSLLGMES